MRALRQQLIRSYAVSVGSRHFSVAAPNEPFARAAVLMKFDVATEDKLPSKMTVVEEGAGVAVVLEHDGNTVASTLRATIASLRPLADDAARAIEELTSARSVVGEARELAGYLKAAMPTLSEPLRAALANHDGAYKK